MSAATASWVVSLDEADDVRAVGTKAWHLARMRRLGLPVPPGFVVTVAALHAHLAACGLEARIASRCGGLDVRVPEDIRAAAREIREWLLAAELSAPLRDELRRARRATLPSSTLVVRSSAVGEDSATTSFAGQLDSCLGVTSEVELERAVLRCWTSYWSERVLLYQRARGVDLHGMGVVVQAQIDARVSGVLFTRSPVASPGADRDLVAEYGPGLGEALMSGRMVPGRVAIRRADLRWRRMAEPATADE